MTANPTPPTGATRVRMEGIVTTVHSDGRFALVLPDGQDLLGFATDSQLRRLGSLIGCRALVLGVTDAAGKLIADGVLTPTPGAAPGYKFSESELAVLFASELAAAGTRPEATDKEMDAMLKDDR